MKRTLLAALTLVTIATLPLSALPPIYMKYDDIKGGVTASGAGTIEIQSWSLGASNPTGCPTSPVRFTVKGTPSAELVRLCQSRTRVGTVNVDADGVKHQFQDATFECQTRAEVPHEQMSLNFAKCTYHSPGGVNVAAGDVNARANAQPNARLIGLPTGPVAIHLQTLILNPDGTSATMGITKLGSRRLMIPSTPLPKLVIELTNGTQKWEFLTIELEDVVISGATGQTSDVVPTDQFSLNFGQVKGPVEGYRSR